MIGKSYVLYNRMENEKHELEAAYPYALRRKFESNSVIATDGTVMAKLEEL